MAARAKKKHKIFEQQLLGQWPDLKMIWQKCSSYPSLPEFLNGSALLNKMVTRAKISKKKPLNDISLASGQISK